MSVDVKKVVKTTHEWQCPEEHCRTSYVGSTAKEVREKASAHLHAHTLKQGVQVRVAVEIRGMRRPLGIHRGDVGVVKYNHIGQDRVGITLNRKDRCWRADDDHCESCNGTKTINVELRPEELAVVD